MPRRCARTMPASVPCKAQTARRPGCARRFSQQFGEDRLRHREARGAGCKPCLDFDHQGRAISEHPPSLGGVRRASAGRLRFSLRGVRRASARQADIASSKETQRSKPAPLAHDAKQHVFGLGHAGLVAQKRATGAPIPYSARTFERPPVRISGPENPAILRRSAAAVGRLCAVRRGRLVCGLGGRHLDEADERRGAIERAAAPLGARRVRLDLNATHWPAEFIEAGRLAAARHALQPHSVFVHSQDVLMPAPQSR